MSRIFRERNLEKETLPYRVDLIQNSQSSVTWNKDRHARQLTLQCSLDVINAVFLLNEMKVTQASSFQLPRTAVFFCRGLLMNSLNEDYN